MLVLYIQRSFNALKKHSIDFLPAKKTYKLKRNRILLVGMLDSPHFQKWLKVVYQEFPKRKILIFPSDRPKSKLQEIRIRNNIDKQSILLFNIIPFRKLNFATYYVFDVLFGTKWRSYFLARFIIKYKPSIIHFHEMQHGAYLFNQILNYKKIASNSRKIISTWGSDLTLYSWINEHQNQIKTCLTWADILTAEREEELIDAQKLGFRGDFRAPIYITIGKNPSELKERTKPSSRRLILVKGYQSDTGRALNALQAISQLSNELRNYEILVYSASSSVQIQVNILRNKHKINIRVLPKVSHDEMCNLFYQARASISLAVSDGLPGVLVEAMQAGSFPIQSANSAGKDFIVHGENGFLVDPWNIELIKESIVAAVTDSLLVDQASTLNMQILQEKYSLKDGIQKLRELYL